jgi:gliding motility-associated-like protein
MPLPFVNILSQTIYCINDEPSIINTIPQTGGTLTLNGAPTNTIDPSQLGVGVHELYFSYTSNIGCSNEIKRLLYVAPNPEIELSLQPISSCPPLIYTFFGEALNGGFCSWDFGNGDITEGCAPISQTYNQTGCYSPIYSVSNEFGCASDTTLSDLICVYIVPEAQFYYTPNPLTIFNNTANFINTSNNGVIYHWEFSVNNNLISTNQTDFSFTFPDDIATFYPVTLWAESVDGCIDSVTYDVIVNPDINLYVPNTFTPDNDKFNDEWFIFINGIDIYEFELVVFNRWGEIVWESRNPNKGWNGTYNGQPVPEGTYVWQISAKQLFIDKRHAWRGHLNVLR